MYLRHTTRDQKYMLNYGNHPFQVLENYSMLKKWTICRWHHPYGRKWRRTKQPLDESGKSFGVSASTSVLPMNIQDWFPLGWTGWISLLSKDKTLKSLLQHHSSKASVLRPSAFFIVQLSHPYMTTGETIVLNRWTSVGKVMSQLLNMLSRLAKTFLPRRKLFLCLFSWL